MFKIYDGREQFYQWDLDRKLIVEDAAITEVHFCNRTDNCSLVCETYVEDGITLVNVPNILLQTDWKIHVYAYDTNYTKHDECYEVISRTKPSDYIYTEVDILNYDSLLKQMDEILSSNLTSGTGEGSIKTVGAADALTANSVSLGEATIAGRRGFTIKEIKNDNLTVVLDAVDGLAVGDTYSYSQYSGGWYPANDIGTIQAINGLEVVLEKPIEKLNMSITTESRLAYKFWVNTKPTAGTADVSLRAFATNRETQAIGDASFAANSRNIAFGDYSTAFGSKTKAYGNASIAAGSGTQAIGNQSMAFGYNSKATNNMSVVMGKNSESNGEWAIGTGLSTKANGYASVTFGEDTKTIGAHSIAEGKGTITNDSYQHVQGSYNIPNNGSGFMNIVGNGKDDANRSNAYALDSKGNGYFAGEAYYNAKFDAATGKVTSYDKYMKPSEFNTVAAQNGFTNHTRINVNKNTVSLPAGTLGKRISINDTSGSFPKPLLINNAISNLLNVRMIMYRKDRMQICFGEVDYLLIDKSKTFDLYFEIYLDFGNKSHNSGTYIFDIKDAAILRGGNDYANIDFANCGSCEVTFIKYLDKTVKASSPELFLGELEMYVYFKGTTTETESLQMGEELQVLRINEVMNIYGGDTLVYDGNRWVKIYNNSNHTETLILKSTDSDKLFEITINDSGAITATPIQ